MWILTLFQTCAVNFIELILINQTNETITNKLLNCFWPIEHIGAAAVSMHHNAQCTLLHISGKCTSTRYRYASRGGCAGSDHWGLHYVNITIFFSAYCVSIFPLTVNHMALELRSCRCDSNCLPPALWTSQTYLKFVEQLLQRHLLFRNTLQERLSAEHWKSLVGDILVQLIGQNDVSGCQLFFLSFDNEIEPTRFIYLFIYLFIKRP